MPESPRGEVSITLAGRELVLRPSFRAYAEIERRIGTLTEAIGKLDQLSVITMATVIWAGCTNGGAEQKPTLDEVGDLLVAEGLVEASVKVIQFLGAPLRRLQALAKGNPSGASKSEA